MALCPGFYRLTTTNRLPNGRQLCRTTDFALTDGQIMSLPLEQRAAPPDQMLNYIPLENFCICDKAGEAVNSQSLPGEIRLLAWLEPGTEPTEHILNEFITSASALEWRKKSGVALFFVLRDRGALENTTLRRALSVLPQIQIFYESADAPAEEELARSLFLEPGNFPLVVLLDQEHAARFASAGYQVGLVELMLKLLNCLK